MERLLIVVILWLLFAIGVGKYATTKGRDATGWFVLALLFSPLIAFVVLAVLQPVAGSQANSPFKKCPCCAETIRGEAKVCRYCGRDLPRIEAQPPHMPEAVERPRVVEGEVVSVGAIVSLGILFVAAAFVMILVWWQP